MRIILNMAACIWFACNTDSDTIGIKACVHILPHTCTTADCTVTNLIKPWESNMEIFSKKP